jgi:hypothetical protein
MTEYCQWETFEAQCKTDEVIIITKAFYGRMQYGRCIRRDYGYVGCVMDVLSLADMRCSGRQSCQIAVPDKLFDGTMPCPEDLKLYLMASYKCIKGSCFLYDIFSCLFVHFSMQYCERTLNETSR